MRTKLADSPRTRPRIGTPTLAAPATAGTRAYWLEKPGGLRVTRLYHHADIPLIFAGRALEKLEALDGWTLARMDTDGVRHTIAAGAELSELARPFMPVRTQEQVRALAPFRTALRRDPGDPITDPEVKDRRVY
jgi:hypothetical protein